MTKKNYIAPEMTVCLVETQAFIAASQFDKNAEGNQEIIIKEGTSNEFGARRHNDIWAEDEEDY